MEKYDVFIGCADNEISKDFIERLLLKFKNNKHFKFYNNLLVEDKEDITFNASMSDITIFLFSDEYLFSERAFEEIKAFKDDYKRSININLDTFDKTFKKYEIGKYTEFMQETIEDSLFFPDKTYVQLSDKEKDELINTTYNLVKVMRDFYEQLYKEIENFDIFND